MAKRQRRQRVKPDGPPEEGTGPVSQTDTPSPSPGTFTIELLAPAALGNGSRKPGVLGTVTLESGTELGDLITDLRAGSAVRQDAQIVNEDGAPMATLEPGEPEEGEPFNCRELSNALLNQQIVRIS